MKSSGPYYIGIDIGATKTIMAAFDGRLRAVTSKKRATPCPLSPGDLVDFVSGLYAELLPAIGAGRSAVEAAGLAVAAPVDRDAGEVLDAPNMGWKRAPVVDRLAAALKLPVALENDVQAGTLGELRLGALRGMRNAIGVFVGTGIGGGIVINGELYRGAHGSAGELGHLVLQDGGPMCGCGIRGCLEALASRTAVGRDAVAAALSGKAPLLLKRAGTDLARCKSSALARSVEAGEEAVAAAVDRSAYWLGVGLAGLVAALDPEAIVIGGGLPARLGERYRAAVESSLVDHLMAPLAGRTAVLMSRLGDLAVPAGAAVAAAEATAGRAAAAAMAEAGLGQDGAGD